VEANSTGGQGSRRAVAPSDDDDDVRNQGIIRLVRTVGIFVLGVQRYHTLQLDAYCTV
jgi:hypothetical protein